MLQYRSEGRKECPAENIQRSSAKRKKNRRRDALSSVKNNLISNTTMWTMQEIR